MKFLIENWHFIALAVCSGAMLLWPMLNGGMSGGGTLLPTNAVTLMNRERAVVVDVSEPAEFAGGHIVGSKNVPVAELPTKLPSSVKNKKVPLILVCATGTRAARVVGAAKSLGYENAQAIQGGLKAWREAGLPLEKA